MTGRRRNTYISLGTLLISALFMIPAYVDTPQAIETLPWASISGEGSVRSYYRLGNTDINHILIDVPGSIVIPLDKVTEHEAKAKREIQLFENPDILSPVLGSVPANVTLSIIKETDGWVSVLYGGAVGYLKKDYADLYIIPVVWKKDSEWGRLKRDVDDKPTSISAIENALVHLTKEYQWGAEGPDDYDKDGDVREGFDCSGLIQWAYHETNTWIPRTTATGYNKGTQIERDDIQIGDLIYFNPPSSIAPVSHVGMYIGDNMMLHATKAFEMTAISEVYWDRMVSIVRYE